MPFKQKIAHHEGLNAVADVTTFAAVAAPTATTLTCGQRIVEAVPGTADHTITLPPAEKMAGQFVYIRSNGNDTHFIIVVSSEPTPLINISLSANADEAYLLSLGYRWLLVRGVAAGTLV